VKRARFARPGFMAMRADAWGLEVDERGAAERPFLEEGSSAIVEIRGPLIRRAEGFWSLFCDDYESIGNRARAAFESGASRVVLRIDSPGGDAPGCFELARELRAMAVEANKPLVAFADGLCASAAMALAMAATGGIVASPTADLGSIGVFEALCDWSAMNAAQGLRVVVVASGAQKTDRNPDVAISDDAIARAQEHVDQFAALFFELAAELRGGTPEQYRKLDAGIFLGAAALGARLADRVGPWQTAIADDEGTPMPPKSAQASKYDEAIGALKRCADGDDDEAKKAKQALKAIEDGEKPAAEDKPDPDKEGEQDAAKKAKADDGEKPMGKGKAEEKEKDEAKAALSAADVRRIFREESAASEESSERAKLLDGRPDLPEATRKALAKLPVADLRLALEGIPRRTLKPAAAASTMPSVQGESQGDGDGTGPEDDEIARAMGRRSETSPKAAVFGMFGMTEPRKESA
jgi:ClpP class serine protease